VAFPSRIARPGGDQLKVRLKVEQERSVTPTANIIATLRGSAEPDTKIVLGCHHDAWVCGAADPTCGTITLLESARSFAQLAKAGQHPARTIVFCAWGAEEFGIIGSSEWVEANHADLVKNAAMYINLDMASMGTDFGSSASPSLRRLVASAAAVVPQPRAKETQTVLEGLARAWAGFARQGSPKFGDLGGGSDHVAFLCYAGVPSASLGGSGSKGNSYHSTFDTLPWYWKVVGEDYEPAIMVTRVTSAVAARMASGPILPLDPARYGVETRRQLVDLTKRGVELNMLSKSDGDIAPELSAVAAAADAFADSARATDSRLLAAAAAGSIAAEKRHEINRLLIDADRAWLSEDGIPGRPWFRSLYAASDEDSGYASWILPGLRWSIEHKDKAQLAKETERLLAVFRSLNATVSGVDAALKS
jgi:N-acetylated-alpha-linked acidic dipeptidase